MRGARARVCACRPCLSYPSRRGCASHAHLCGQAGEDEADAEGEMLSEEEEEEEEGRGEGEGGSPGGPSGSEATFVTLGAPNT